MKIKQDYLKMLGDLTEVLSENEDAGTFLEKAAGLKGRITDFVIKVPLIGRFSAGKSRLLNAYLEREILEWADSPTTAVATEIKYAENERILVNYSNGGSKELAINDIGNIGHETEKISYIELYLNVPRLQEREGIVLVDMPGIDSNKANHTEAVANYIANGHYFVAVTAPRDAFNDRLFQFVDEFANYSYSSFSFIITRQQTHGVEEIKTELKKTLAGKYKKEIFLGATEASGKGRDISDFIKVLDEVTEKKEEIFKHEFKEEIIALLNTVIASYTNKLKGRNLTVEQIEANIKEVQELIDKERSGFNNKLEKIKHDITSDAVEKIMHSVSSALGSNFYNIKQAHNVGNMENEIENIIRPIIFRGFKDTIINAEEKLNQRLVDAESNIDATINLMLDRCAQPDDDSQFNEAVQQGSKVLSERIVQPLAAKAVSAVSKIIIKAGFASLGGVIGSLAGPIGIIVGIVVGEFVSALIADARAGKKEAEIERHIKDKIIPQVIANTGQVVRKEADRLYSEINTVYKEAFESLVAIKLESLTELKNNKETAEKDFTMKKELWSRTVNRATALLESWR